MSDSIVVVSTTEPAPKADAPKEQASVTAQDAVETPDESETSETAMDASDEAEDAADKSEESEESDKEQEGKQKENRGFRRRIDKFNKKLSEKEKELEYWKAEALKSKDAPKAAEKVDTKAKSNDGRPQADQYESHEEYVEALTDWKLDERDKAKALKEKETQAKTEFQNKQKTFAEKLTAFQQDHDDFDEAIEAVEHIPMPLGAQDAILESEIGPELMYELAKNPEVYERISKLSLVAAVKEIGKIEDRLLKDKKENDPKEPKDSKDSHAQKAEPKTLTKAPTPMAPVGKGSSVKTRKSIYDPNLTQAEYEELRAEQLKARRA